MPVQPLQPPCHCPRSVRKNFGSDVHFVIVPPVANVSNGNGLIVDGKIESQIQPAFDTLRPRACPARPPRAKGFLRRRP